MSLCGIFNQLLNFSVTGFCKKCSFVFHDGLKVQLERLLVSWPLFRRNKVRPRIQERWLSSGFVSRDQFYPVSLANLSNESPKKFFGGL